MINELMNTKLKLKIEIYVQFLFPPLEMCLWQ